MSYAAVQGWLVERVGLFFSWFWGCFCLVFPSFFPRDKINMLKVENKKPEYRLEKDRKTDSFEVKTRPVPCCCISPATLATLPGGYAILSCPPALGCVRNNVSQSRASEEVRVVCSRPRDETSSLGTCGGESSRASAPSNSAFHRE
jgi:hypothetical protein